MERVEGMKWLGTAFILSGILMTNLNIYPLNIFLHGSESARTALIVNKE